MLFETGIVKLDFTDDVVKAYIKNADKIVSDDFEKEKIKKLLQSSDQDLVRQGILRIMALNVHFQSGTLGFTGGKNEALQRTIYRSKAWSRFIHWLGSEKKRNELSEKLTKRGIREIAEISRRMKKRNA